MGHIPHLYLPQDWSQGWIELGPHHLHHLRKVMRIVDGEPVSYTDGKGTIGRGSLDGVGVERGAESTVDRPTDVTVAMAPPGSSPRSRMAVEKLAELGVVRLQWVRTIHAVGRPPSSAKTDAWTKAGLEQSRGAWAMDTETVDLAALVSPLVVADPSGSPVDELGALTAPTLLVGPEGGLAPEEIPTVAHRLGLGPTVLRMETAAIVGAFLLGRRGSNSFGLGSPRPYN